MSRLYVNTIFNEAQMRCAQYVNDACFAVLAAVAMHKTAVVLQGHAPHCNYDPAQSRSTPSEHGTFRRLLSILRRPCQKLRVHCIVRAASFAGIGAQPYGRLPRLQWRHHPAATAAPPTSCAPA